MYKEGIIKAIKELGDRSGSSMIAIRKLMQANFPADKKWMNTMYLAALKTGVKNGDFIQNKASYKLSSEFKKKEADALKPKKKQASKKTATKTTTKKKTVKKTASKKKTAPKKTAPKKMTAPKKKAATKKTSNKKSASKKKTAAKKVKKAPAKQ